MKAENTIIVIPETSGDTREDINRRLIVEAARIARGLGGDLHALVLEESVDERFLQACGVSTAYHVKGLPPYSAEAHAWAVQSALKGIPFRLLLMAHSDRGGEIAPRVAFYLDTAAVTDCADIRIGDGSLFYARMLYGGQLEQEVSFADGQREVATIAHHALSDGKTTPSSGCTVVGIDPATSPHLAGPRSLEVLPPDHRTVDILYAKRIVGAGSGCGDPQLLKLAEELADLLQGALGTTRPMVDDGYLLRERMIGQTGKMVMPELYIALGISGSPHHVAGIQGSKEILSLNLDPRAPIFGACDTGYIGDLKILLPRLIERIKCYRDEI